ncbi:MAG: hypothetical protein SFZ24_04830 [Planctomycetota bacterium]|nr:hypothetical protein [Planctomycetota bacterium]
MQSAKKIRYVLLIVACATPLVIVAVLLELARQLHYTIPRTGSGLVTDNVLEAVEARLEGALEAGWMPADVSLLPVLTGHRTAIVDGWKSEVRGYVKVDTTRMTIRVLSAGPDGVFDTPDDVSRTKQVSISAP